MIPIGHVKPDVMKLLKVTEESLFKGIEQVKVGNRIGAIGHAVQTYCEKHGYGVVRDFIRSWFRPRNAPKIRKYQTMVVLIKDLL